jgi:hypothetical protein
MRPDHYPPPLQANGIPNNDDTVLNGIQNSTPYINHFDYDESPAHQTGEDAYSYTGNGEFPRLSRPVELMRPSYDVVVIGSGYGGAVAASRMARGRQSVCLLELGREKWRM